MRAVVSATAALPVARPSGRMLGAPARAPVAMPIARLPLYVASPATLDARHVGCRAQAQATRTVSLAFEECRKRGRVAMVPFIVAGDPDLETTKRALMELDAQGADVIELGVPYSDPLADGPVIQAAAVRALDKGTTVEKVVALVREVAPKIKAPLVLFTYFNPILKRGLKNYLRTIKEAGAAGLLVPDLPLEGTQTEGVQDAAREAGIELVLLATPTTPQARMETIARETRGFVYLVSVTGVTGVRKEASTRVEGLIKSLKEVTDKPVAVGFGVSGGEQAKTIAGWGADGVIVGSAFVKRLGESGSAEAGLASLTELAKEIRGALPQGQ